MDCGAGRVSLAAHELADKRVALQACVTSLLPRRTLVSGARLAPPPPGFDPLPLPAELAALLPLQVGRPPPPPPRVFRVSGKLFLKFKPASTRCRSPPSSPRCCRCRSGSLAHT